MATTVQNIFIDNADLAAFQRNRLRGCRTWKKAAQRFARYKADRKRTRQLITDEEAYTHSRNEALKHESRSASEIKCAEINTTIAPPSAISTSPPVGLAEIAELRAENARLKQELASFQLAAPPSVPVSPHQVCTLPAQIAPPVSPCPTNSLQSSGEASNLEHLYECLVVHRLQYFPGTDENSTDCPRISSNYDLCTAPFLVFHVVQAGRSSIRSEVRVDGTSKRMLTRIESGIDTAVRHRKRYVWFPIRLCRSQYYSHANALLVDTRLHEAWLFEPHGCNPSLAEHGQGFQHYYEPLKYYRLCEVLVMRAYRGGCTFHSPAEYQPELFGQSVSGMSTRGDESADAFCVFWCLWFFTESSTRSSPKQFIEMINTAHATGTLSKLASEALAGMSSSLRVVMQ